MKTSAISKATQSQEAEASKFDAKFQEFTDTILCSPTPDEEELRAQLDYWQDHIIIQNPDLCE